MDLPKFVAKLAEEIEAGAPSRYEVTPQEAYAKGGFQRGDLYPTQVRCRGCALIARYYSEAGSREIYMSGMCEPCFDFTLMHPDDREALDGWMELVKRRPKEG